MKQLIFLIFMTLLQRMLADTPISDNGNHEEPEESECQDRLSCSYLKDLEDIESITINERNCFCDNLCHIYNDCCEELRGHRQTNVTLLRQGSYTCSTSTDISFNIIDVYGIYVIIKCPLEWEDKQVIEMCETENEDDIFTRILVTGDNKLVYRNVYCAACHGITSVTYWNLTIFCQEMYSPNISTGSLLKNIQNGTCGLELRDPSYSYRQCKPFIETCPNGGSSWIDDNMKDKCQTNGISLRYVKEYEETYKNLECALCNGVPLPQITCVDFHDMFHIRGESPIHPFSLLVNLNSNSKKTLSNEIELESQILPRCEASRKYDYFTKSCRSVLCSPGYVYVNNSCLIALEDIHNKHPDKVSTIDCPRLNYTDFKLYDNKSLYIRTTGQMYTEEQYEIYSNMVLVCATDTADISNSTEESQEAYDVLAWITLFGLIISAAALALNFIVYMLLPSLRNNPGKNLLSLITALFIAYLMFLVGLQRTFNYGYTTCLLLAVFAHYCFLASLFWMNVMSFDIWQTFGNADAYAKSSKSKNRFIWYSIYAWLVPLCIVISALVTDQVLETSSPYRPKYGVGVCWIAGKFGLLIFFMTPLAITLTSNFVFYILTAKSIYTITETTRRVTQKKGNSRLLLYIKLCAIMGLTWIFGILASFIESVVLDYFFTIFNCCQGLLICLSFICNTKVWHQLSDKYSCGRKADIKQDTATTSVGKSITEVEFKVTSV